MKQIYFEDFRQLVLQHSREIRESGPEFQSVEWFLLRYLKKIDKNTLSPADPGKVESSMRGLIRFYVDMIDENSTLGDRCKVIYTEYRKTIRESQEN